MGEDRIDPSWQMFLGASPVSISFEAADLNVAFLKELGFKVEGEEEMKTIGVKFREKGELSNGEYSFVCSDEIHSKLVKGSEVIVNTRFGTSLAVVTRLNWVNPPVAPYKNVVALVSPADIAKATAQEDFLKQRAEKLANEKKIADLMDKMTDYISAFSPMEICYMIGQNNPKMNKMWDEYVKMTHENVSEIYREVRLRY